MESSELKGYLTGLIVGDGYIDSGVVKRRFEIKSIDRNFINKIKTDIESCSNFKINIKYYPEHDSSGCHHKESWAIEIKSHPYFAKKYHHFYDDYKNRIVSRDAARWLTPAGIANWYMSDGYICHVGITKGFITSRRIDFCTDRYDMESINRLQNALLSFGVATSLNKRGNRYRIRVCQKSYETFIFLIYPHLVDSMKYKVNLMYQVQPPWMSDEMWEIQQHLESANPLTSDVEGEDIV